MAKTIRAHALLLVVAVLVASAACAPPGAKTESQAAGSGGKEGKQVVQSGGEAAKGAGTCDVKPPDVELSEAKVGFSQTENNNPWRIAQTESMKTEGEKRAGQDGAAPDADIQAAVDYMVGASK